MQHQREGQVPLRRVGVGIVLIGHVGPVLGRPRQPMEAVGELDVGQFGQPDFHRLASKYRSASPCRSAAS